MNANDVINNLTELMMKADNERDYVTLNEAINLITVKGQHMVPVPCRIGDVLYSVIGENVGGYVITGFWIDREKVYMESSESMLFPADKVGIYYFWSQALAEREFNRRRKNNEKYYA